MSDRTGYALGRLNPIIFFEHSSGHVVLAPGDKQDETIPRMAYESKYRALGYEWREAGTLAEVDRLQSRLCDAEKRKSDAEVARDEAMHGEAWRARGNDLYQRMISAGTSQGERDFIRDYLKVRAEKREKYHAKFHEYTTYLWASAMDSGTKVIDRMHSEPGDHWRSEQQQK